MRQLFVASIAVVVLFASALQSGAPSTNPSNQSVPVDLAANSAVPATLQQQVAGLWTQVALLQSRVTTSQSQVATLRSQVATLQSQVATSQSQNASLQSRVTSLTGQVNSLTGKVAALMAPPPPVHRDEIGGERTWHDLKTHLNDSTLDKYMIHIWCPNLLNGNPGNCLP